MKKIKTIVGFIAFLYGCFFLLLTEWQRLSGNDHEWLESTGIAIACMFWGVMFMLIADKEQKT